MTPIEGEVNGLGVKSIRSRARKGDGGDDGQQDQELDQGSVFGDEEQVPFHGEPSNCVIFASDVESVRESLLPGSYQKIEATDWRKAAVLARQHRGLADGQPTISTL